MDFTNKSDLLGLVETGQPNAQNLFQQDFLSASTAAPAWGVGPVSSGGLHSGAAPGGQTTSGAMTTLLPVDDPSQYHQTPHRTPLYSGSTMNSDLATSSVASDAQLGRRASAVTPPVNPPTRHSRGASLDGDSHTGFSRSMMESLGVEKPLPNFATQTRANAFDPSQLDPKRAKRIIANRQSAHRSRVKKLQQVHGMEQDLSDLREEVKVSRRDMH